jgi:hypothetical protein
MRIENDEGSTEDDLDAENQGRLGLSAAFFPFL